ncbi:hypothetical protein J3F84DRAFT_77625 [Trichoderma pleuroticola]
MSLSRKSLTCPRCSRRFTRASSLTRHCKRCLQDIKGPSRRKSCNACARAKLRCDLQRPRCSRCQERTLTCEYVSRDGTTIAVSTAEVSSIQDQLQLQLQGDQSLLDNEAVDESTDSSPGKNALEGEDALSTIDCGAESTPRSQVDTSQDTASDQDGTVYSVTTESEISREGLENSGIGNSEPIAPELIISNYRSRLLLNEARRTPNTDPVARHTMHFVIRVLKSWPRMMGSHLTSQLPPMIHRLQLADGIPIPLANCCTLAKMWIMHSEGSRDLVQNTVHNEVRRLLRD